MTRPKHDPESDAGFTLLEMLVVTMVFGLLSVALWEGLSVGTRGWATQQKLYDHSAELEDMENALRRIIARAETSDTGQSPALTGTSDRLRLIFWLPEDGGYHHDIEAGLGLNAQHQLVLRWRAFRRARCPTDDISFHEEILLRNVRAISFQYYGRKGEVHGWQDIWRSPNLPLLVKIHFTFMTPDRVWPDISVRPLLSGGES